MYLFLLGILLGAIGVCYATKPSSNLSNMTYLSSEIERHEFLACYFRKMLQSANERANLTNQTDRTNRTNRKKEDADDDGIMRTLIEKKEDIDQVNTEVRTEEKNDTMRHKAVGQQDGQLMDELLEKIDRPYNY